MNRRGFLGTLMASIVGTAFAPSQLLWLPTTEPAVPIVAPTALLTLDAITYEMAKLLEERLPLRVEKSADGVQVGHDGAWRQFGVDLETPKTLHETGLDVDRYLKPACAVLAASIGHDRWTTYGELPLPSAVERVVRCSSGKVSVRGMLWQDYGESRLRFDVIGA